MDEDRSQLQQQSPASIQGNPVGSVPIKTKVTFPEARKKKSPKKFIILVVIVIIALLAVVGYFIFKDKLPFLSQEKPTPTPFEQEQIVTPTPIPTQRPAIDRNEMSIQILNGTGISGEAAFLQKKLGDMGYSDITVGNASSQNYETTEVIFNEDVASDVKKEIVDILDDSYVDVKQSSKELSGEDIQIITGLRPGQSFPPTNTPAPKMTSTPTPTSTASATPTP